jgi:hypothetical protein
LRFPRAKVTYFPPMTVTHAPRSSLYLTVDGLPITQPFRDRRDL